MMLTSAKRRIIAMVTALVLSVRRSRLRSRRSLHCDQSAVKRSTGERSRQGGCPFVQRDLGAAHFKGIARRAETR